MQEYADDTNAREYDAPVHSNYRPANFTILEPYALPPVTVKYFSLFLSLFAVFISIFIHGHLDVRVPILPTPKIQCSVFTMISIIFVCKWPLFPHRSPY